MREAKPGSDFLMQVRWIDYKIQGLQYKIYALESCLLPKAITYDKDPVQTSPEDKLSEITGQIFELQKIIDKLQRKKDRAIRDISDAIDCLEDEREKAVLYGYYVARKSISEIALEWHYSPRSTYRFLDNGRKNLANMANPDVLR